MPTKDELDFYDVLRIKSKDEHSSSDALVTLAFPYAVADRKVYRELLTSFYYVYREFEQQLRDKKSHFQNLDWSFYDAMQRSDCILKDIKYLAGPDHTLMDPNPPTLEYISRIQETAQHRTIALFAYPQTMYGALLFGGQILNRMLRIGLGLTRESKEGTEIFDFSNTIPKEHRAEFMANYKSAINDFGKSLDGDIKAQIIMEKKLIFSMNNDIIWYVVQSERGKTRIQKFWSLIAVFVGLFLALMVVGFVLLNRRA